VSGFSCPPVSRIRWYEQGETCVEAKVGDLFLLAHDSLTGKLIRFGERLRGYGRFSWCNHAAVVVGSKGGRVSIAEATAKGVVVTELTEAYSHLLYAVISFDVSEEQRSLAAAYAAGTEGVAYAWLTIVGEVIYVLTGLPLALGWGRSVICSGDAATALICSGLRPDKAPSMVMPSDLARYAGAVPSSSSS
jgi:hypothetical protein